MKEFAKKHGIDVLVAVLLTAACVVGAWVVGERFHFSAKWAAFTEYFFDNQGYLDLLEGMKNTAIIAVFGMLMGLVLGSLIAVLRVLPPYKKLTRYVQKICSVYVAFFRGTPIVVQRLIGYYLFLPLLGVKMSPVMSCTLIFGLNSAAYISEMMRGGIQSVDAGQLEGARAMGLPFSVSMVKVVIPQAVKNILPTLGNEFIALVKETAIVGYVGALDITKFFQDQGANTYEFMIPYLVMALLYIVIVCAISFLVKLMERKLQKNER